MFAESLGSNSRKVTTAIGIVVRFIEHINARNVDALCGLMSEDHRFIDPLGAIVQGKAQVRQAWTGYFHMVPDYHISVEEMLEQHGVVVALGTAGGTFSRTGELLEGNRWQVAAAWRVEVSDNLVAEWKVYADNEPLRRLMAGSVLST